MYHGQPWFNLNVQYHGQPELIRYVPLNFPLKLGGFMVHVYNKHNSVHYYISGYVCKCITLQLDHKDTRLPYIQLEFSQEYLYLPQQQHLVFVLLTLKTEEQNLNHV